MNPNCHDAKNESIYCLMKEYDTLQGIIRYIKSLSISDEAKNFLIEEIQKEINKIKERMHNYIDTL